MSSDQVPPQGSDDPAGGREWLTTEDVASLLGLDPKTVTGRLRQERNAGTPAGDRRILPPDWPPENQQGTGRPNLWQPGREQEILGAWQAGQAPPDDPRLLGPDAPDDLWCGLEMAAAVLGVSRAWVVHLRMQAREAAAEGVTDAGNLPPADETWPLAQGGPAERRQPYWRLRTLKDFKEGRAGMRGVRVPGEN